MRPACDFLSIATEGVEIRIRLLTRSSLCEVNCAKIKFRQAKLWIRRKKKQNEFPMLNTSHQHAQIMRQLGVRVALPTNSSAP
jgi:hypothetical protein